METFFVLFLLFCGIAGAVSGVGDMRKVREGKAPGVARDNDGHAYYFLGSNGDSNE